MKSALARTSLALGSLALLLPLSLRYGVLPYYDARHNTVLAAPASPAPPPARALHQSAFVADLHADSLLWGRDLRRQQTRGHVDLPRLRQGGVDLQVFGVVTLVPRSLNYRSNRADSDALPLLFAAAWRSPLTWFDPRRRALAQARELGRLAAASELTLVLRRGDLAGDGLKGLLSLEGMHALGGEPVALEELFDAGFRMMGLAHFTDNAVAGSAHGSEQHGLTALGRQLIPRMERLGITLDLAHASPAAFGDALDLATRPVVVSHGGVAATCPGVRNLSDAQLRRVAANGGVVGIGYWRAAVCSGEIDGIVAAILHAVRIAGIDHVGLGSDFDGHVAVPFDARGLPRLTASLLAAGMQPRAVRKVLGGNVRRVLEANLPP